MGGGCGRYELDVRYPVEDGNCGLETMMVYRTVDEEYDNLFGGGPACCSGLSGIVSGVMIGEDIPDERMGAAITVREFIMEYGPEEVVQML